MKKLYKRISIMMLAVFVFTFLAAGCSGEEEVHNKKTLRVGVVKYIEQDDYINALTDCLRGDFEKMEKSYGLHIVVTVKNGAGKQAIQDKVVEEMIDAGCDILCVDLVDRTAPTKIINMARKNNIPVIFFNRELVREDLMQWEKLYYVGGDAAASGIMQGELAAGDIQSDEKADRNRDGRIQYVVLEGETGHQDAILRTDEAVGTLTAKGVKLDKIRYEIADWSKDQARNKMSQLIRQHHAQIELVLANNDAMALGAREAYEQSGLEKKDFPKIYGIDGLKDGLKAVASGELQGTVYNDKEGQAQQMALLSMALYRNETLKNFSFHDRKYLLLPYQKVDGEEAVKRVHLKNFSK